MYTYYLYVYMPLCVCYDVCIGYGAMRFVQCVFSPPGNVTVLTTFQAADIFASATTLGSVAVHGL